MNTRVDAGTWVGGEKSTGNGGYVGSSAKL
jgi:hypothetical protein